MTKSPKSPESTSSKQAVSAPRRTVFLLEPEVLILIGVDTADGPEHKRYDAKAFNKFDEDMVLGIMEHGVHTPITVVKLGDRLEIHDGRQRTINAREANRRLVAMGREPLRVPVTLKSGTDTQMFSLAVILNEHRVDDTPLGLAAKVERAYSHGHSDTEVASMFKCSVSSVKNYRSLLTLLPEIQQLIATGKVSATKGYILAAKGSDAQTEFLAKKDAPPEPKGPRARGKADLLKLIEAGALPEMFLAGLKYALGQDVDLGALSPKVEKKASNPFTVVKKENHA